MGATGFDYIHKIRREQKDLNRQSNKYVPIVEQRVKGSSLKQLKLPKYSKGLFLLENFTYICLMDLGNLKYINILIG